MKLSLIVLLAALVAVATANRKRPTKFKEYACSDVTDNAEKDFENFIKCHFRGYSADRDDKYHERRSRFEKCRKAALRNDPDRTGYSVGLTRFCFWTSEELRASQNYLLDEDDSVDVNLPVTSDIHLVKTRATPVNFSWVDYGAVSSVKDQKKCGDCYTFAAAGALEGAYQIKYGQLYNLSVQQYTSCSRNYTTSTVTYTSCTGSDCTSWTQEKWYLSTSGNDGCNGGTYTACWAYNNMTGLGTNSWECYPFTSGYGNVPACSRSTTCSVNVAAKDYVKIPKNNETMLFNAVATAGPVACSIDSTNLSSYTGGVFNGTSTSVNHAVLVVGFGTTSAGQDYWVVKNSWGSDWGINGYFWLARGTNAIAIAKSCAYPLV